MRLDDEAYAAMRERLNDYDLPAALFYNDADLPADIVEVVLELTGQNDGDQWHWVVRYADGSFGYIAGGCDYTGWDCQSGVDLQPARAGLLDALADVPQDQRRVFEEMLERGERVRSASALS